MPLRILLVGAGAIGAFYGSRLATVSNVAVSALCRSNFAAVKQHGFRVTSSHFADRHFRPEFIFQTPEEARKATRERRLEWSYLVVATKALPDVSDDSSLLEGLVGARTVVVLVQNGLGVEEPYRRRFPATTILGAVTIASCVQPEHGLVTHHRWTRISVAPYLPRAPAEGSDGRGEGEAERVTGEFVDLLRRGGIDDAEGFDHDGMQFIRWHKVAINAAMNPTAVLSGGCDNRQMSTDAALAEHLTGVMDEVLAAACKVLGRPLPRDLPTPHQVLQSTRKSDSGSHPSMWMDWEGGKRMELEVILGNPIRMAKEVGVEMPRLQTMYALLRMAQEKREQRKRESKT